MCLPKEFLSCLYVRKHCFVLLDGTIRASPLNRECRELCLLHTYLSRETRGEKKKPQLSECLAIFNFREQSEQQ